MSCRLISESMNLVRRVRRGSFYTLNALQGYCERRNRSWHTRILEQTSVGHQEPKEHGRNGGSRSCHWCIWFSFLLHLRFEFTPLLRWQELDIRVGKRALQNISGACHHVQSRHLLSVAFFPFHLNGFTSFYPQVECLHYRRRLSSNLWRRIRRPFFWPLGMVRTMLVWYKRRMLVSGSLVLR